MSNTKFIILLIALGLIFIALILKDEKKEITLVLPSMEMPSSLIQPQERFVEPKVGLVYSWQGLGTSRTGDSFPVVYEKSNPTEKVHLHPKFVYVLPMDGDFICEKGGESGEITCN